MGAQQRSSSRLSVRTSKRSSNHAPASSSNIKVFARFRPLVGSKTCLSGYTADSVEVDSILQLFEFDRVFGPGSSQEEVFETAVRPTIDGVLEGYNGCVLAYGQTGAGKSHTMMGPDITGSSEERGAIPRMVEYLFERKEPSRVMKVSYFEIYNEKVKDLIGDSSQSNMRIHETNGGGGFYVKGLEEVAVTCTQDVLSVMQRGSRNRTVASTNMNTNSSRSHSVFLVDVIGAHTRSKLLLVDLAGSEKVAKTGARGQLLEEASNINRSLTTLGMVVNALASNGASANADLTHVPFRDSKLTRVLQDSLAGNSRTCLIVHCSPDVEHQSETVSTLRFGSRAKAVKTSPRLNTVPQPGPATDFNEVDAYDLLNGSLEGENRRLQALCRRAATSRDSKEDQIGRLQTWIEAHRGELSEMEIRIFSGIWKLQTRVVATSKPSPLYRH